jgi:hypothetical protein
MLRRLVCLTGLASLLPLVAIACAARAASFTTVIVCGSSVAIPDVLPPTGSGPVVLMAAPCQTQDDGGQFIPQVYRRHIQITASRPLDGVWVPFGENTMKEIEADYRRLWDTGRLSDLTFEIGDYTFPNGVVGKVVTYLLKEQ